jgi:hypothetical protein
MSRETLINERTLQSRADIFGFHWVLANPEARYSRHVARCRFCGKRFEKNQLMRMRKHHEGHGWQGENSIASYLVERIVLEASKPKCKFCAEKIPLKKYLDGTLRHFDGLMAWHVCEAV